LATTASTPAAPTTSKPTSGGIVAWFTSRYARHGREGTNPRGWTWVSMTSGWIPPF
jgi:hypothetical protein